ncbi:MAG: hypothetical protein PHR39_04295 [Actinomycetota bacterium]|nr:hypothetical protein [Actinomycetota bacterium]
MELKNKEDFDDAVKRVEAWWEGEIIDRVPIMITAPKKNNNTQYWIGAPAFPLAGFWSGLLKEYENVDNLESFFTDPEIIIPRNKRIIEDTLWGGEAIPNMFPVTPVSILTHYLGSPIKFLNFSTTWSSPIIKDWKNRKKFRFDQDNEIWLKSKKLLKKAADNAAGNYIIGIPDLNGPGETLSGLRGSANLAMDTIENADEIIRAMEEINHAWLKYWQECHKIINNQTNSYTNWMSVWSEKPATDLQCDFSAMISPESFKKLFVPFVEQQTEWVPRSIYHLDGPGALTHIDAILKISGITAIQWVPGAGSKPISEWTELLRKIQKSGKKLFINCGKDEIKKLMRELNSTGLLLETSCGSREEMEEIIRNVRKWTRTGIFFK